MNKFMKQNSSKRLLEIALASVVAGISLSFSAQAFDWTAKSKNLLAQNTPTSPAPSPLPDTSPSPLPDTSPSPSPSPSPDTPTSPSPSPSPNPKK